MLEHGDARLEPRSQRDELPIFPRINECVKTMKEQVHRLEEVQGRLWGHIMCRIHLMLWRNMLKGRLSGVPVEVTQVSEQRLCTLQIEGSTRPSMHMRRRHM